jgi:hypothetical protein
MNETKFNRRMSIASVVIIGALVVMLLRGGGCVPEKIEKLDPVATPVQVVDANRTDVTRFKIEHMGSFNAGYQERVRDLMVVTDTKTGAEYLAITDCSIIRLKDEEDEESARAARRTAEALSDILE